MFENFDFSPGKVTYNDFNLDPNLPLDEDNDGLKEDMFQVVYPQNYAIDVGWYSGVQQFIVYLIKDCNWEEPIEKIMCTNLNELEEGIESCIKEVNIKLIGLL